MGQMLHELRILQGEVEQLYDMGDGYMQMPVALFEQHVYPSAFLRSYLQGMGDCSEGYQAGVETTLLYAFHMQYQNLPAKYTALDLQLLRASSQPGDDVRSQVADSSEMATGLSVNATNTLDKLEEECQLPNYRTVQNWSRPEADARAENVRETLAMYRRQAEHDYRLLRTTREKNIYLGKLTASQAIENLLLNSRVLKMVDDMETQIKSTIGADLKAATEKYKEAMASETQNTIARLETQYEKVLQKISPYDMDDARQLLLKQTELVAAMELANTMLVSENAKLRMHMSFMPIRYRQEIETMQSRDNETYRDQRKKPMNFSPQDSDNHAGKLKLVEAPRAHEMTQRYIHACEYAGMKEMRENMREAKKLKKNLYSNVIPKRSDTINAPALFPKNETATRYDSTKRSAAPYDSGKGKSALRAGPSTAEQGPTTRRRLEVNRDTRALPGRNPLDYRLVHRNQSPPKNAPQNRYVDLLDGTEFPGDPDRDRASRSGPMADKGYRNSYDRSSSSQDDNTTRQRSMSSERSREQYNPDNPSSKPQPARNREPWAARGWEGRQESTYSYLQRPPKGKSGAASKPDVIFPKFYYPPIAILPRANALRHLEIERPRPPPTEAEALNISDYDLADLLRKPSLGLHDRENHVTICGQLREMYVDNKIGIEMHYERGSPSVWLDILGQVIPKDKMDGITYKYYLPPEKDQGKLGNYWWVVRLRPMGGSGKYEYMVNKDYSYKQVSEDFARMKTLTLAANRWYLEGPIEKTVSLCLYPYHQYCPGLDIDFRRCNINLQINRLQYMEETKEPPRDPQCLNPIRREDRKREHHEAVQLLVNTGAIPNSTKGCLEDYLVELEASHTASKNSLRRIPFATARKFLLMHQLRLAALIKAVKAVLNHPDSAGSKQHGSFVNNLPPDTNMNESDHGNTTDEHEGDGSPSHGDSNPPPTPPIEQSTIQYVHLPLPKQQGQSERKQDRQSGGRGGNHR